jgi:hypothetical protein
MRIQYITELIYVDSSQRGVPGVRRKMHRGADRSGRSSPGQAPEAHRRSGITAASMRVPIPLRQPDPDIPLDLASAAGRAYEQGRYGRLVNYAAPVDL